MMPMSSYSSSDEETNSEKLIKNKIETKTQTKPVNNNKNSNSSELMYDTVDDEDDIYEDDKNYYENELVNRKNINDDEDDDDDYNDNESFYDAIEQTLVASYSFDAQSKKSQESAREHNRIDINENNNDSNLNDLSKQTSNLSILNEKNANAKDSTADNSQNSLAVSKTTAQVTPLSNSNRNLYHFDLDYDEDVPEEDSMFV